MLRKEITYTNFNDEKKTKTFMFGLSETEFQEFLLRHHMNSQISIEDMSAMNDAEENYKFFKDLVLSAYGMKSDDGDSFMKTPEIRSVFEHHAAFDALMLELLAADENGNVNTNALKFFIRGIMPAKYQQELDRNSGNSVIPADFGKR